MDHSFPVDLPVLAWGPRSAARRALLLHGVGSAGSTWWQVASGLAAHGWRVEAPDLRGHGTAPATLRYRLSDYASDLTALGGGWDLLVGHSLGGAVAVLLAYGHPGAARRLLLVDPALYIPQEHHERVVVAQAARFDPPDDPATTAEANPRWHPEDIVRRERAHALATRYVVERTFRDNPRWDLRDEVAGLGIPVLVLGADPGLAPAFPPELGAMLTARNPLLRYEAVAGATHSMQRDDPDRVLAEALALGSEVAGGPDGRG
ncbi:MAG TPA: alpha/beta fold hydrolase [Micromonosporaceae bacterium]|nr:alpha/beta fold hydrolase [Micromonosporaceae bacterium]